MGLCGNCYHLADPTVCYQMSPQIAFLIGCIVTLVAFFVCFSPLCVIKWVLKSPASEDAQSHLLHLFVFSPLCLIKCFLKSLAQSHWLYLCVFSPLCVFKCLLKEPASEDAQSHWLHVFSFSPLCLFKCALKGGCIVTFVALVWFFSTVCF